LASAIEVTVSAAWREKPLNGAVLCLLADENTSEVDSPSCIRGFGIYTYVVFARHLNRRSCVAKELSKKDSKDWPSTMLGTSVPRGSAKLGTSVLGGA